MSEWLDSEDMDVVHEALDDIEAEAPPKNWGALGVGGAVMGVAMLLALPLARQVTELPRAAVMTVLAVGAVLVVLGVVVRASSGGFARGRSVAAAEAALRQLESEDDDRETALRAATLLLAHAYAMYGPRAQASFDFGDGRRRLGSRLALVESVERRLVAEDRIDPVFTDPEAERG